MRKIYGFSVIELLLTLVIIAILASLALPTYQAAVQSARRREAITALLDIANRMERYFSLHHTYASATINTGKASDIITAGAGPAGIYHTPQGYYDIQLSAQSATHYVLRAHPQGAQQQDTECGRYTIDERGQRGVSGPASVSTCWR